MPVARIPKGYRLVALAEDLDYCKLCGEPVCPHKMHWSDCTVCIGPGEEGVDYLKVEGRLYGRKK